MEPSMPVWLTQRFQLTPEQSTDLVADPAVVRWPIQGKILCCTSSGNSPRPFPSTWFCCTSSCRCARGLKVWFCHHLTVRSGGIIPDSFSFSRNWRWVRHLFLITHFMIKNPLLTKQHWFVTKQFVSVGWCVNAVWYLDQWLKGYVIDRNPKCFHSWDPRSVIQDMCDSDCDNTGLGLNAAELCMCA